MSNVRGRLIIQFLLVSAIGVALVWLGAMWATGDTFHGYVQDQYALRTASLVPVLSQFYELTGGWEGVGLILRMPSITFNPGWADRWGVQSEGQDYERIILLDARGYLVYDSAAGILPLNAEALQHAAAITVRGNRVGYVLVTALSASGDLGFLEQAFLSRVRRASLATGAVSMAVALFLAVRLSKGISSPLEALRDASSKVAQGDFGHQVADVPGAPMDMRELVRSFNYMSRELKAQEQNKREFLSDVAHEVRTPLTIIKGNLEAISLGISEPDEDTINAMSNEVTRLEGLLANLDQLDMVQASPALKTVPVLPSELVSRAAASVQGLSSGKGIAVEQRVEEGLPPVQADLDAVSQVFSNLLSNAFRYTPSGGTITIRAYKGYGSDHDKETEPFVTFEVTDTGEGIAPEDLPRVFERFFRGDKSRARATGGSGLGLAIAKKVVERHGGRIWAESVLGQGSSFFFTLPVSSPTSTSL